MCCRTQRRWLHGGVLQKEMSRLKLGHVEKDFLEIVRKGLCMFDRDVSFWIKKQLYETGFLDHHMAFNCPLKFDLAIEAVLPRHPIVRELTTKQKDETECHVCWLMASHLQMKVDALG